MAHQRRFWIEVAAGASAFGALSLSVHAQSCYQFSFQDGGGQVSLAGATLFVPFFQSTVSTHDWLDADGDGCSTTFCKGFPGQPADQLAPPWSPGFGGDVFFELQYRSVGSVNGYREFIANQLCGLFSNSVPAEFGLLNTYQWATGGVKNPATAPGCDYLAADTDGDGWAFAGPDGTASNDPGTPAALSSIDIAVLDVPSFWATINDSGAASWSDKPGAAGYGDNPIPAANVPTYLSKLPSLCRICPKPGESLAESCDPATNPDCTCLNTNITSPDEHTIYDNTITWVPIAYIANRGVGNQSSYDLTDLRHLMVTGRRLNGENLVAATRSIGSGTRNGMMNTTGIDPSWGMGENLDAEWGTTSQAFLGPAHRTSNAAGSGQIEETVKYSRLALGYTGLAGAGRAAADVAAGQYEILGVVFNDQGGTVPVRPTIASALLNCSPNGGYRLGGPATFVTRGSLNQSDSKAPDYMDNQVARLYVRNIYEAIAAYDGTPPPAPAQQSPADYLVTNFTLIQGQSCVNSLTDPTSMGPNPDFSRPVQAVSISSTTTVTPAFGVVTPANLVPRRVTAGQPYADETQLGLNLAVGVGSQVAVQYGYKRSSGAVAQFGLTVSGTTLADKKLSQRNRIAGDFNRDGQRNSSDIALMMKAAFDPINFEQDIVPAGGWGGGLGDMPEDVVIAHVIGDFDGNGQFDKADVRYFADGLALVTSGGPMTLNRQTGFTSVDTAWLALSGDPNYFDTVIHDAAGTPTGTYSAGDARADIAGATPWAGAQPHGHDGVVDCADVLYVAANLGHFQTLNEAAITAAGKRLDLSADMNGNLVIDCADVAAVLAIMGEVNLNACGIIASCLSPADLNHDGHVNGLDLAMLLAGWTGAATYPDCPPHVPADLNHDCRVNGLDLASLLAAWNP